MDYDDDYVLCECDLEPLRELVTGLEQRHRVTIVTDPSICLALVRAEDSLEKQEFCLGEALTTECEVAVDNVPGYGVCLGEEPVRGYCLAVVDALRHGNLDPDITAFLDQQRKIVAEREKREFNLILRSQVDFKLMEHE